MPKRQKDLIGGLSRRDAEKAILMLRCLHPEILTLPPRKLFDIKKWSAINGFSKNSSNAGHSSWYYLRNKILKSQQDDPDANGATSNVQEDDSVYSTSSAEITVARRGDSSEGKGKAAESTNSATQDPDDDDDEPVAGSTAIVERVIEFVDQEAIEIKDEDQFELDWRNLELHQQR